MSRRILVVDDEEAIRRSLKGILEDEKYEAVLAASGEEGLKAADTDDPDLVLLDIWLPGIDGIVTLQKLKEKFPNLPVIMMSGHGTIETAVKATKLGAFNFIEKPLNLDKLLLEIEHALKNSQIEAENKFLRDQVEQGFDMVGQSPFMLELKEQIRVIGPTRASVLVTGENGTGKELVARAIHKASKRAKEPFVEVNCAAIPESLIESELFGHEKGAFTSALERRRGKFDLADGGTLFLDEVGDMSLNTQAKILRVLQEMRFERVGGSRTYQVDVRIIAATNKNLEAEIAAGRFREDLFFRLNVIPIHVEPLRTRREDIPLLVERFLAQSSREYGLDKVAISPQAMAALASSDWPGNVRELKNMVERLVIMSRGKEITADKVPHLHHEADASAEAETLGEGSLKDARREFERRYIVKHLTQNQWNVSQTATQLDMDRSGLYKKIKELEIELPEGA